MTVPFHGSVPASVSQLQRAAILAGVFIPFSERMKTLQVTALGFGRPFRSLFLVPTILRSSSAILGVNALLGTLLRISWLAILLKLYGSSRSAG